VDLVHQRPLAARVEAGRVHQEHLDRVTPAAGEAHLFDPAQLQFGKGRLVEGGDPLHPCGEARATSAGSLNDWCKHQTEPSSTG